MTLFQNCINRGLILVIAFLLLTHICFSQNKPANLTQNPVYEGSISGKVRDSLYKNLLNNATVTVYRQVDTTLLKFVIPDRLGSFQISALPLQTPLKLTITHVGYTSFICNFELSAERKSYDLGWVSLLNSDESNQIEEVSIMAYTPVKMNGDTIEFNPKAFKLEANATTEDLMRVLPGIVIWGDGDITFNGKKIQSLLVDGKPFIGGGDMSIATQNLPKEVIDKVQIYNQRNDINPLDSTLHANLKLLDTKKVGYFGKLGLGFGTDNR